MRLSVWIEIVRHTTDKAHYVKDDHRFMLHIFSTLKHTLPDYDYPSADKKLEEDVKWHLEHFNMPAWNRILEKLVHRDEDDNLKVAVDQLMAYKVQSPQLLGRPALLTPYLRQDIKFPREIQHITMESMVDTLVDIIYKARKWEGGAHGYQGAKKALQTMGEIPHVYKLYEQDWDYLKTRVGPKSDDQHDFLRSMHKSIGI